MAAGQQLELWETTVTATGAGTAMVARRPVVARRLSTRQVLAILRPVAGEVSTWQIQRWVREGKLDATRPGAVGTARERSDGRRGNHKLAICAASVAALAEEIRQGGDRRFEDRRCHEFNHRMHRLHRMHRMHRWEKGVFSSSVVCLGAKRSSVFL